MPNFTARTTSALARSAPLLAASLLALSACAGPTAAPGTDDNSTGSGSGRDDTPDTPIPVEGIDGSWIFADGVDNAGEFDTDATVTLVIVGDNIAGQSACNSYTTSFTGESNEIAIGSIASTERACLSVLMDFDRRYFSALELVTTATPTGGSLVLQGGGVVMNFLPDPELPEE